MRDFTLDAYMTVIEALRSVGLPVYGVAEWARSRPVHGAVIRHDVDRRPANALRMAQAEAQAGVRTTYYFRVVGSAYNKGAMLEVARLGHEVGYHYEDLALARGDASKAIESFAHHLADLRGVVDIQTAAMHGSPMSSINNLDIWQHAKPADFGLLAEAFIDVDYRGLYYFTDTGRSWGALATNLRDRPAGIRQAASRIRSTAELVEFIRAQRPQAIALSAHPERWEQALPSWLLQATKDHLVNLAKVIVNQLR